MKFKKIEPEYFPVILDRLTRFEPAYIRFKRVFNDIINKYCINTDSKAYSIADTISIVEDIFSYTLNTPPTSCFISDILYGLEDKYFNKNETSYQYLSARLNISSILDKLDDNAKLTKNVIWLKNLSEDSFDLVKLRESKKLLYPIEKILLCEGETEKILLNTMLNFSNVDMDKLGILLIAAGGKNQVARKYYEMIEYTKTPFFILLDKDATETKHQIELKQRDKDEIYILSSGEFEDLIPVQILANAINMAHSADFHCKIDDFQSEVSTVHNIEQIYRKYGFGDFKKADFAKILKEYIIKNADKSAFSGSEITQVANKLAISLGHSIIKS